MILETALRVNEAVAPPPSVIASHSLEPLASRDPGSFRDPAGHVFILDDEVVRSVNAGARASFEQVIASGILEELTKQGLMIPTSLDESGRSLERFTGARGETPAFLLLHPRLDFVTYAHEWTFSQLKDAALCHLDVQLVALAHGVTLSDASVHNIQFHRGKPLHIDPLSLRPYIDGEAWAGYNQFCRMFLLPLLIEAWAGVGFQLLLKGSVDGIPLEYGASLLPRHKLLTSVNGFLHVFLHARMTKAVNSSKPSKGKAVNKPAVPKSQHVALLKELRHWINSLQSARSRKGNSTYWSEYAAVNSYSSDMRQTKAGFVDRFARRLIERRPSSADNGRTLICDIGGNTGEYSKVATDAGVALAIIFDSDLDSLEVAYARYRSGVPVFPMLMDIADPSAATGWNQSERKGLNERSSSVTGVLALAVIHHLCIGRNLPLKAVVRWLVGFAAEGVIEFVPKSDPMVHGLLSNREDVFSDYDEVHFLRYLNEVAHVTDSLRFDSNGRLLISYLKSAHA